MCEVYSRYTGAVNKLGTEPKQITFMATSWDSGKPVLDRLPEVGYRDNAAVQALVAWPDLKLTEVKNTLETFHDQLDPLACDPESLDFLAYLVGLSDEYWDSQWTADVKRGMIAQVNRLWTLRGTFQALTAVLDIHGLDYDIWSPGELVLPFDTPANFGRPSPEFYIRLPLAYNRGLSEWAEAQRTLRNFGTFGVNSAVTYDRFYCGFSRVGDIMF